ncbi:DUF4311 domain-containing protein, partial [Salmonella enterica subsp. enterica serovar Anatum]|nr:DUF4311 domain-containing protein [Salmonella enterica subsp. enterica serovar Anatum]
VFGGAAQLIMGNAVPGLVLGILIGKGVEESGWNHVTKVMMVASKGDQAERALDRLIDIDLEYVNQMNELRVNALRFKQLIVTLK